MASRESYLKGLIRRRYARIAEACADDNTVRDKALRAGYPDRALDDLPRSIVARWSGCGYVLDRAPMMHGKTVVDLGAGSGVDCLLAAGAMNGTGRLIAVDLAPEALRRVSAASAEVLAVAGDFEALPIVDETCDVIIANAAFNLAVDLHAAFAEAARILRPGGELHICDLVRDHALPVDLLTDPMAWSTSLGGVPTPDELTSAMGAAGFTRITLTRRRPFPPVVAVTVDAFKPPNS